MVRARRPRDPREQRPQALLPEVTRSASRTPSARRRASAGDASLGRRGHRPPGTAACVHVVFVAEVEPWLREHRGHAGARTGGRVLRRPAGERLRGARRGVDGAGRAPLIGVTVKEGDPDGAVRGARTRTLPRRCGSRRRGRPSSSRSSPTGTWAKRSRTSAPSSPRSSWRAARPSPWPSPAREARWPEP